MKNKVISNAMRDEMAQQLSTLIVKTTKLHGFKDKDLAELLQVHQTTFGKWKRGKGVPRHYSTYTRVISEMRDINKQERDRLKAQQGELPLVETLTPEPAPPEPAPSALDIQVGGNHYKNSKIQPIQYIEANDLTFLEGSIVKRVTRHNKRTGKGTEDMLKVIHEAQLILEMRYKVAVDVKVVK